MNILKIIVDLFFVYVVITMIFQFSIITKKLKPSKLTRLFYNDDELFSKAWKRTKEKGMLKYVLKNTIIMTVMMSILGIFSLLTKQSMYGEAQSQTLSNALLMGVILGILFSLMLWYFGNDRFNGLKEKDKVK